MNNYNQQQFTDYTVVENTGSGAVAKTFFARVFLWMFAALAVSTLFAFLFANSASLMSLLISETGRGLSLLGKVLIFAPIGFVLLMNFGFSKLSSPAMLGLFMVYAAINGITFSFILLAFSSASVIGCFASAAVMFGVMAIMGYTTKQDLTSFGRILTMALVGIVVAMLINFFMHSAQLDYIVSIIGVLVFTGLTAYDVQKLKRIGAGMEFDGVGADNAQKIAILGALTLYLDFINLFLMLLRLFGRRK
jgi:FtsH-binding integral membrane protein